MYIYCTSIYTAQLCRLGRTIGDSKRQGGCRSFFLREEDSIRTSPRFIDKGSAPCQHHLCSICVSSTTFARRHCTLLLSAGISAQYHLLFNKRVDSRVVPGTRGRKYSFPGADVGTHGLYNRRGESEGLNDFTIIVTSLLDCEVASRVLACAACMSRFPF